jgi:hypothetical protein
MRAVPVELEEAKSGVRVVFDLTFECDGQDRPVCVAQAVYLLQMQ